MHRLNRGDADYAPFPISPEIISESEYGPALVGVPIVRT